ncbi:MAG: hypothetical protein ACYDCN_02575 [Bacteroidia bacterium]
MKKVITTIAILVLSINAFAQKKHPKVVSENVSKKNMMDKKTHPNSDIIDFKFADGVSCHMVKNGDSWFNYNIRGESKEKQFASKEAGLQTIWSDAVKMEAVGAAAAGTVINNKNAKNPNAMYDYSNGKKYNLVNGKKVYVK